jgi:integrase
MAFTFQYRVGKKSRRINIGNAEVINLPYARRTAQEHAHVVSRGGDPLAKRDSERKAMTVAQLVSLFEDLHVVPRLKPNTAKEYMRALRKTILPALGKLKVSEVTRGDVTKVFLNLHDKPTQANRTLEIISKMFNLAEEWDMRAPGTNPRKGIKKNPETKRERFLSEAELAAVAQVLCDMEGERVEMPSAIMAIRLLILTGCRLNEIMKLQWSFVDRRSSCLRLPDSKTGKKDVPVGEPVLELLQSIPRIVGNPYVITAKCGCGHLADLQPFWQRVRLRAGLIDARIHDLRHTFATMAASQGMSLPIIGKMLGHKTVQSTQRYAHLGNGTMSRAANEVAAPLVQAMQGRQAA